MITVMKMSEYVSRRQTDVTLVSEDRDDHDNRDEDKMEVKGY